MKLRRNLGFTLIEVLLIIGLLGSVTAIAAPNFLGAKDNAEEEACQDQMDFILSGFQTEQLYPDSPYAFAELEGTEEDRAGEALLNKFIDLAINPDSSDQVGFPDHVVCPSGDTDYEAWVEGDRLYVHCKVHDVLSHASLGPRPLKTDPTVYDTGDGWTSTDNNMIVGDHESLMPLPIESEYYHMEIKVRLVLYDDGIYEEGGNPSISEEDPAFEYRYKDPEYYWPINTAFYSVDTINADEGENAENGFEADRPRGYDLGNYNPTNEELFFGMIIDYQEDGEETNFTSNSLEIKNVISNANLDMELDLVERDEFNSTESSHVTHERNLMDTEGDWFIIDVLELPNPDMKRMVIHMQQEPEDEMDSHFKVIFDAEVPVANQEEKVDFAFFIGKRDVENSTKVGRYYTESYPTPVQAWIQTWNRDFDDQDQAENLYTYWIDREYMGYPGSEGATIPYLPYPE